MSVEQIYQKKTQVEHCLFRPATGVGSVVKHWDADAEQMTCRISIYVPTLHKICVEIPVNAADNRQRDKHT